MDEVLEAVEAAGARSAAPLTRPDADGEGEETEAGSILGFDERGFDGIDEQLLVAGLLDHLDDRSRQIIELRFFQRLGQDEIAKRLGVSQSYLSRVLRKILVELRSQLEVVPDEAPDQEAGGPGGPGGPG